jgi:sRNA-binding protein
MAGKTPEEIKKQKDLHDEGLKKNETREKTEEYDGLTLKEMRRKHGISEYVDGQQILDAYRADNIGTVKKEETAEEIAHTRKVLDQAKMELEWDRKERDSRRDLEGEENEQRGSKPEESQARRANPQTGVGAPVDKGVFSNDHMDFGYGLAADIRRVVLYEGLKRDPRTGKSVATGDMARQYMNPGQVLERTLTLEGHIELDKFSIEMMALEDVVILRDLCNNHLNSMVKKVSIVK